MAPPTFTPDAAQSDVLSHGGGTLLLTGPPGSGKTTVLRERFARLVEDGVDPERVALFTLSRRAAREARSHLIRRIGRSLPDLPVFTSHGFAFRLLADRFPDLDYPEPPRVLSAPEQYSVVRDLLRDADPADWPHLGHLLGVPSFQRQLADFVLRCQERLLDPDDVMRLAEASERRDQPEVARFYRRYLDALSDSGATDFAGLLFQAVTLLDRTSGPHFDHLLIDDYHDATLALEGVVTSLARAAESTVVAADPAGHVFSYRGGTPEPLQRSDRAFPAVRRVALPGTHRQGVALEAVERLAAPAVGARVANAVDAAVANGDGHRAGAAEPPAADVVEARLYAHPGEETEAVAHELLTLRVDGDVPWGEMAVVTRRYGSYLTALRHALTRHAIPFVVVAEASELAGEPAIRPVIDLMRYALRPEQRDELVEALLASFVGGIDPHNVRRLRREARIRGISLRELIDGSTADAAPLADDLRRPVEEFGALVQEVAVRGASERPDDVFFRIWERLPYYRWLVETTGETSGRERELDAVAAFAAALSRFSERRPGDTMEDYLGTLDVAEFGPDPWIPPEERVPNAVRVISAHRAQGLEFEAVMVVGCLEGEFPSLGHGAPLVSLERLVTRRSPWERVADRLAEERALFRLATSRARRKTILFASRSTGARTPRTPSRFAERLQLEWAPPREQASPAPSLRSMEAALRRRLASPADAAAARLAAAAALQAVGARPETWWGRRDWTDPGVPLYPDEIRTSYSRLSTLENCGLQYLYQVELGLDDDETFQMWVGSTVHGILDRVQRGEIERDLAAMVAALDAMWRPDVFPNRAVEHRRYLDARDMLDRWLRGEQGIPVLSEKYFEFPIDGAVVRGRIDAVFRMNNGHLRVVDYKTSRYPITAEEAKTDLQLAAYYLAMLRTPDLAALGKPAYLQLDYLGKANRDGVFTQREVAPGKIDGYEDWADSSIRELVERVRREDFAYDPDADCMFCTFQTICPRYEEGREPPVRPWTDAAVAVASAGPDEEGVSS